MKHKRLFELQKGQCFYCDKIDYSIDLAKDLIEKLEDNYKGRGFNENN